MDMKPHSTLCAHDSIIDLETAVKKERDPFVRLRIKAILLRKRGKTPQEIAESLVVTDRSVTSWINKYNSGGLSALATKPSGRSEGNPKWDVTIFDDLAKEIDKGGYWSIPRMQEWLTTHKHVDIPEQTVWYRMDQLHYSYKGARPHPVQGNKEKQDDFKKTVSHPSWSR
jgi:transposase